MNWIVIKVGFTIHANQSNVSQVKSLFFVLKLCGKNLNRVDFGSGEDNMHFENIHLCNMKLR